MVDNAFVYVASRPRLGTRVRSVQAILDGGRRVDVPFASAPYGMWDLPPAPTGKPLGPDRIDRSVPVGTVGWIVRHEASRRGAARDMVERATAGLPGKVLFTRLIDIDPARSFADARRRAPGRPTQSR